MSSLAVWRRRRISSLFATAAMVALVACDSSTSSSGDAEHIAVNPSAPTMNIGQTQQLVATVTTDGGRILNPTVSWSTSSGAVATVSAGGLVTAVAGGTATITAEAAGLSEDVTVTVWFPTQSVAVALAAGAGNLQTIRQEGATQLAATILDSQGNPNPARQLVWTSSNTDVATVSGTGRVSARGIDGVTTITATTLDGVAGNFVVNVSGAPQVATVTLAPTSSVIGIGQTVQVTRTARAASGTIIPGVATVWASSAAGNATVDAAGLVTGVALGTTNITATAETITATAPFTVLANLPAGANAIPNISDAGASGGVLDYALHLPAGTTSFSISTTATGGDTDLYVFAPGVTPGAFANDTFSGFTCRPWLVGSTETCTVNAPVAGVYRIRFHAFPGGGTVTGLNANVTITP